MTLDEKYMLRCIRLAELGAGSVAPNPMVGAVLVYDDRIIGEGYHELYGKAHAEVNCIASVKVGDRQYIPDSTLYVSLEPCSHHGKTPPCTDLIITNKIPRVVTGTRDPFSEVNGSGLQRLKEAGIEILENILGDECKELNKRFFTFHTKKRPYIILKWAQSVDNKIAGPGFKSIAISNDITNRLVHKWRSEEASIMIGANTALYDNPSLTTRLWKGPNPTRIIIDPNLRLPGHLTVFNGEVKTIIFNYNREEQSANLFFVKIHRGAVIPSILNYLHQQNIQSVIVEGGTQILQSFIDEDAWDEARIILNSKMIIGEGIQAPTLTLPMLTKQEQYLTDLINYFHR